MQFTINKSDFVEGISKVQGISSRKTPFVITQHVKITAEKDAISIEATDLEVAFRGTYKADVKDFGVITIPAKKLYEIIREFPSETIACKVMKNGWVEIADTKVQYQMVGMDPNDFPSLPEIKDIPFISVDGKALLDAIEKVDLSGGLTSEEKRPHLIGLLLEYLKDEGAIRFVSTDGNRLAKVECALKEKPQDDFLGAESKVILHKKILPEIRRIVESGKDVKIGLSERYFVVGLETETLICVMVEGDYPDYNLVIPKEIETFFNVEKSMFHSVLRRISIFISENYRAVRFKLENDKLTLYIVNPEIGESKEEVNLVFNGQPFEALFNPRFFIDAIAPMSSETVRVRIESDKKGCIVEGDDDPSYLSVIMPMRM